MSNARRIIDGVTKGRTAVDQLRRQYAAAKTPKDRAYYRNELLMALGRVGDAGLACSNEQAKAALKARAELEDDK